MNRIADLYKNMVEERIEGFQLPEWLEIRCEICGGILARKDVLGFELNFIPIFLGNVSFSYHCPSCNSLICMHLLCDVKNLHDLTEVFDSHERKWEFVLQEKFISEHRHRALEILVKKDEKK